MLQNKALMIILPSLKRKTNWIIFMKGQKNIGPIDFIRYEMQILVYLRGDGTTCVLDVSWVRFNPF